MIVEGGWMTAVPDERHVQGICDLLAATMRQNYGLEINPLTDVVICCGQSEAFAAAIFATINQGDEVLLFDPAYETYESCITLAGGVPVYVPLDPPCWTLNVDKLMKSFTTRTKAVVLNRFVQKKLIDIGSVLTIQLEKFSVRKNFRPLLELAVKWTALLLQMNSLVTFNILGSLQYFVKALILQKTVYSLLVEHVSTGHHCDDFEKFAGSLQYFVKALILQKTVYSLLVEHVSTGHHCDDFEKFAGWRIGWACAPAIVASAIRNIHIKITDSAPAPFQEAAVTALQSPPAYFKSLKADYEARRDYVVQMLSSLGLQIWFKPQGSVFVFAELPENWLLSDIEFVKELIEKAGVAAVPGCGFFHADPNDQEYHNRYVRFAFCKSDATLNAAAQKMRGLVNSSGYLDL
ncbi:Aminotransferase, class I/classII [Cocos nucifera]|uniref:Aminotransferase, class I/classII n=1 Tax=Cocos nucifera TaxID=13894 RepID=A0A8K0I6H1_COCNU|nr:Aminotransferase, class I/classII [Cocos nucifera]